MTVQLIEERVTKIKALIPPGQDCLEYLCRCIDTELDAITQAQPMGIVPHVYPRATQVVSSARITAELLDAPDKVAARPEGIVDLGVIEWLLRPAIELTDGLIVSPSGPPWNGLATTIAKEASQAVCRLDLFCAGYESVQIGTGFVVGTSDAGLMTIMTNAHVVREFQRYGWPDADGISAMCDFAREKTEHEGELIPLAKVFEVHANHDLALMFLDPASCKSRLPKRLTVTSCAPDPTEWLNVGVIGHPSFDSTRDPFLKHFGFGDRFGVKRLSPGFVRTLETRRWLEKTVGVLLHDATTLSGSSGSCILDIRTMQSQSISVVGLHFGGWPARRNKSNDASSLVEMFEANGAVPLWLLADDPMLKAVVTFR